MLVHSRLFAAIVAAVVSLCGIGAANAGPHEEANAADARGDYAAELAILRPAAAQGRAWAQNNLGNAYLWGDGVAQDDAQALAWFSKAAAQQDGGGELNVGQLYEKAVGVPRDLAHAASLYRLAGEHGKPLGWRLLKRLCDQNHGVAPNDCASIPKGTQAAPWFSFEGKAATLVNVGVKLLLAVAGTYFGVRRLRAYLKKTRPAASGATLVPADSGATAAPRADFVSLIRFILVSSVVMSLLTLGPAVWLAISRPGQPPWSPGLLAWMVGIWPIYLVVYVLRLRQFAKGRAATPVTVSR